MTNYIYEDGLETERLYTRFLKSEDYLMWIPFYGDVECSQFLPGFGSMTDEERAKHMVKKQLARYQEKKYGLQLLINKSNDEIIGMCGLLLQDVEGVDELEVGYHLFKKQWGKGYATEAAKAFKDYGFNNNQALSIISMIDVGNHKSQQVALRNGMTQTPQIRWMDFDIFIYRIHKHDWAK